MSERAASGGTGMGSGADRSDLAAEAAIPLHVGVVTGKLGIWLFLASEVMFFAGLIGSYLVLRMGAATWPDPTAILDVPLLAVNTFVLIVSSLTMVQALHAIERDDVAACRRFLGLTILLGLTFLGIKLFDSTHLVHAGLTPASSLFGSCFFLLTGFHGLHVLGGVVALASFWFLAGRETFGARRRARIEYVGLYWHFVDLVWIVLFAILCLV